MSNGATYCSFYVKGGKKLGDFLMYTPPCDGDIITFGEGEDYKVETRVFDAQDAKVRITVVPYDNA